MSKEKQEPKKEPVLPILPVPAWASGKYDAKTDERLKELDDDINRGKYR